MSLSKLRELVMGSLACCSPWVTKSPTWLSDWTELNWEWAIQNAEGKMEAIHLVTHSITSTTFCLLVANLWVQPTFIGGRKKLHFFLRKYVKESMIYSKVTAEAELEFSFIPFWLYNSSSFSDSQGKKTPWMFPRLTSSYMIDIMSNPSTHTAEAQLGLSISLTPCARKSPPIISE